MQHLHIIEERSPRVATRFSRVSFHDAPVFFHVAPKRLGPRHPNALQFIHVPSQDPQVAYLVVVCGVLLDFWTLAYIRDAHQGLVAAMRSAVSVDNDRHRGCHRPETAKVTFTA